MFGLTVSKLPVLILLAFCLYQGVHFLSIFEG